jgi:hypothetical protein
MRRSLAFLFLLLGPLSASAHDSTDHWFEVRTAANFTPKGDLNPCTDIEGLKAKVQYAEVSDKSVAGQIISVELSK